LTGSGAGPEGSGPINKFVVTKYHHQSKNTTPKGTKAPKGRLVKLDGNKWEKNSILLLSLLLLLSRRENEIDKTVGYVFILVSNCVWIHQINTKNCCWKYYQWLISSRYPTFNMNVWSGKIDRHSEKFVKRYVYIFSVWNLEIYPRMWPVVFIHIVFHVR
jgi:hypothetical protein